MKETDRLVAYIRIVDVGREARRVERQIGGKRRALRAIHALEAIETCVKGRCPPRENPMRTIFAGSMRGCVESTARAR